MIGVGAQWGDEGKGKVVDMLATDVDVVCRCQVRKNDLFLDDDSFDIQYSLIIVIISQKPL